MNILGNDFDKCRLLHVFWILIQSFLGLINTGSRKLRCQHQSG